MKEEHQVDVLCLWVPWEADLIRPHPAILESQLLCDMNREWSLHKNASLKHQARLVTTASSCEQAGIDCASVAREKCF